MKNVGNKIPIYVKQAKIWNIQLKDTIPRGFLFTTSYHKRLSNATKYIASGDYTSLFSLMIYDAA